MEKKKNLKSGACKSATEGRDPVEDPGGEKMAVTWQILVRVLVVESAAEGVELHPRRQVGCAAARTRKKGTNRSASIGGAKGRASGMRVRDWVLQISMNQQVDQSLDTNSCGKCGESFYVACLTCPNCKTQSDACILTGYPITSNSSKVS